MGFWDPTKAEGTLAGLRLVMFIAADDLNFKKGAFKGRITADTQTLDALDTFLNSNHFSTEEKGILRKLRRGVLSLMGREPYVASDAEVVASFFMMIAKDTSLNGGAITLGTFMDGIAKRDAVIKAVETERNEKAKSQLQTTDKAQDDTQV